MDRETAKKLIELMLDCTKKLDDVTGVVNDACPEEEARKFRSAAGKIIGHIFVDILDPVYREHPELEPAELRSRR